MSQRTIRNTEDVRAALALLAQKFRDAGRGSLIRALRKIGVGRNYLSDAKRRGILDYGTLLTLLRELEIEPRDFFEELHGDDPDGQAAGRPRRRSGSPSAGGTEMAFRPADPELAAALAPWLDEMDELRYDDCEAALTQLRGRAREIPRDAGARYLAVAASCLRMAGDLEYAGTCLDAAERLAGSDAGRGEVLQRRSALELSNGRFEEALALAERAEGIYARLGDRDRMGQALVDQGSALWQAGDAGRAAGAMEQAARVLPGGRWPRTWCVIHQHLAVWAQMQGRTSESLDRIQRARELAPDRHHLAGASGAAATAFEAMERWDDAARAHHAAYELLGEPLDRLLCLARLVRSCALAGARSQALHFARLSAELTGTVKGPLAEAAIAELYRLTAVDCAQQGLLDGIVARVAEHAEASRPGDSLGDRSVRARRRAGVGRPRAAAEMGVPEVSLAKIEAGATPGAKYREPIREWIAARAAELQLALASL